MKSSILQHVYLYLNIYSDCVLLISELLNSFKIFRMAKIERQRVNRMGTGIKLAYNYKSYFVL